MSSPLVELLRRDCSPQMLVVGDVMLDRYRWGEVERISPEAPIAVLRADRQEDRLGGAGSVAAMLAALGAEVTLAAAVGDDAEGETIRRLLDQLPSPPACLVTVPQRPTTVKERLLGRTHSRQPQQMIRVDRELREPLPDTAREALLASIHQRLQDVALVLISDYGKGVCTEETVPAVVQAARAVGVPVVADPVGGVSFHRYRGTAVITPNRSEAAAALGMSIGSAAEGLKAAGRLLQFGSQAVAVTLDRDGIAWADQQGNARLFPVRPRQVCDITGAGDMVLSALGYALAAGAHWSTAVELANLAGGLEVQRLAVVPISREELLEELAGRAGSLPRPDLAGKLLPLECLLPKLQHHRQRGQQIVMTNGCFDLLHPGHVALLQDAACCGDVLVVGLNSDQSVRQLKGQGHPIVPQQDRAAMLAALAYVDYIVLFDEPSVAQLVEQLRPDVLVKGAEYRLDEIVGHETVERYDGRIVRVPMLQGYSTSALVERILRSRSP